MKDKRTTPRRRWAIGLASILAGIILLAVVSTATAQRKESTPAAIEGVGIVEHPEAQIPLHLEFIDSNGKKVTLGKFFDGQKPVILTLNYSDCPRLCIVQLNKLVEAMGNMKWDLGDQYEVVTVSIDPLETPDRARLTKQKYIQKYGRPGGGEGWHFLVGSEENIKKVADTVGFGYRLVDKQYIHVAALFVCMPDGRVSRYLYGVDYDPQTLRLSLYEAGQGKVGSSMDQILLYCFHYDPASGRYGPAAFNLMRFGGVLTVVVLGAALSLYWVREKRKAKS